MRNVSLLTPANGAHDCVGCAAQLPIEHLYYLRNLMHTTSKKDTALKKYEKAEEKKVILYPDSGTDTLLP
jgi:predicted aldo/keto reductase-like oxidoreductase